MGGELKILVLVKAQMAAGQSELPLTTEWGREREKERVKCNWQLSLWSLKCSRLSRVALGDTHRHRHAHRHAQSAIS